MSCRQIFCGAALILTLPILGACKASSEHPPSSLMQILHTMTQIGRLEEACYRDNQRYCSFSELPLEKLTTKGSFQMESPVLITLEDYDLRLSLSRDRYCMAAVPVRGPREFTAIWQDPTGKQYDVKYPWEAIPPACLMPN